ncbi:MAG: DUF4412 domain-containing protein [Cytophagales bacterium]|nr:DUF4412 domain-containing protein [Cytophagales bacterium]
MMKSKFFFFILFSGVFISLSAQDFEGVVTFKINLVNPPKEAQQIQSMLPETMVYVLKGNKTRMEMEMMGGSLVTILDGEAKTSDVLMDMMGQKMHTQSKMDDFEKGMDMTDVKVHSGDTKKIAGYSCKRITGKSADGYPVEIYYTDAIQSGPFNEMLEKVANVSGLPLEFTVNNQGMKMLLTATEVKSKDISDNLFEIPDGYQKVEGNPFGGG